MGICTREIYSKIPAVTTKHCSWCSNLDTWITCYNISSKLFPCCSISTLTSQTPGYWTLHFMPTPAQSSTPSIVVCILQIMSKTAKSWQQCEDGSLHSKCWFSIKQTTWGWDVNAVCFFVFCAVDFRKKISTSWLAKNRMNSTVGGMDFQRSRSLAIRTPALPFHFPRGALPVLWRDNESPQAAALHFLFTYPSDLCLTSPHITLRVMEEQCYCLTEQRKGEPTHPFGASNFSCTAFLHE